jgi:hypothetical protein
MINEKMANGFIAAGWGAATIAGALTGFGAVLKMGGLNYFNLIDAGIYFGLAFGIFRKSRVCAGLLLLYYLINQYTRVAIQHFPISISGLIVTAIFTAAYLLSIIGTIALRRERVLTASVQ